MYHSIRPGELWLDTDGKPIQAHGFSVIYDEKTKLYYWFGENKEYTHSGGCDYHWGVKLYSSFDLYNWKDCGLMISPTPGDLSIPTHPTYGFERPHILYCEKTKKYVAWIKVMRGCFDQGMCIMQSDHLEGPYEMINPNYQPLQMDAGDFALHFDKEKQQAYIIFARPHFELICAELTDDFTAVNGKFSTHFSGLRPPYTREAPTFFERNGKKYLFTSGTTGYFPNVSKVCTFKDYHDEYIDLGDPCIDDIYHITFNSQITCVLKIPNADLWIACADRWMPYDWVPSKAEDTVREFEEGFKDYVPDLSPKTSQPLAGVECRHYENTCESRYVWLPVEWDGDKPILRWYDEWKIEDFM